MKEDIIVYALLSILIFISMNLVITVIDLWQEMSDLQEYIEYLRTSMNFDFYLFRQITGG